MKRYPKICRIEIESFVKRGKQYLTAREIAMLLGDSVVVEEKLDGKLVELEQEGYVIYKENLKRRHSVAYTELPAWEIGLDVWDVVLGRFLYLEGKAEVFGVLDLPTAPVLFVGHVNLESLVQFLGAPSAFGAPRIEGIVVKNYQKGLFGKIVDPLFDRQVDESVHHLRRPYVANRLRSITPS